MRTSILFAMLAFSFSSISATLGEFAPENQDAFKKFVAVITEDEVSNFISGSPSLIGDSVSGSFSATSLGAMYEKNELLAKKELKGKPIRIKTIAAEIGENFAREAYIRANGENQFKNINMLVNGEDDRILSLKVGDKVDMVCESARYVMHTPILSKCIFTDVYAKNYVNNKWFPTNFTIDQSFDLQTKEQALFLLLYKAYEKKIEVACLKSVTICKKAAKDASSGLSKDFNPEDDFVKLLSGNKEKARQLFGDIIGK